MLDLGQASGCWFGSELSAGYHFMVKPQRQVQPQHQVKPPRYHPAIWIAFALFAILFLGSYLRLFISVGLLGFMDESYWVASSLLSSLGGRPYFNELFIQQTASLLYEPLTALYYKLFGNFAIVLFVRHLFFLLSLVCTYLYFKYFRTRTDLITALAIATLPLVGTFWGEPSLGYNAIGGLCFGAGALLALRGLELNSNRLMVGSGVFFFFSLGAYPTLLAGLILLWILIASACVYLRKPFIRKLLLANAVTAVLLSGFLLSLILREGFENVLFVYRFSTAHSSLGSFTQKITYGFFLMLDFLPPLWFWVPAFLLWLGLWKWKGLPWQFFAAAICIFTAFKTPPEEGPFHPALFMLLASSGLPFVIQAAREDFAKNWADVVLWTAALLSTCLTCWSSALTIYVTYVTSTYCMAVVYALSRRRGTSNWISLLTFVIPLTVFANRVVMNQLDDRTTDVELFTDGPNAGIWTSGERYGFLSQLQRDVTEASAISKTVLFYNEFPLGYLMSPMKPATRTMFLHTLRESGPPIQEFFRQYYNDPANRPDVIFRFKYFTVNGVKHSVEPGQFKPYEDVFWNYLPSESEYSVYKSHEDYTVFIKNRLL
ncbi:MAG: hypothetical protein ACXVA9_01605 [Bdellovibrionales bacterium]